jgi:hypothetical protein
MGRSIGLDAEIIRGEASTPACSIAFSRPYARFFDFSRRTMNPSRGERSLPKIEPGK